MPFGARPAQFDLSQLAIVLLSLSIRTRAEHGQNTWGWHSASRVSKRVSHLTAARLSARYCTGIFLVSLWYRFAAPCQCAFCVKLALSIPIIYRRAPKT